jgi:hypothetical protein
MKSGFVACVSALLCAALALLPGCATSKPARFYLLEALENLTAPMVGAVPESSVTLGVGPVTLPEYLDRPQIVTRDQSSRLELAEHDRWAEPLAKNFARVLTENLSALLTEERVAVFLWPGSPPVEYRVAVEVLQFDGFRDGTAILLARWSILGRGGRDLLLTGKSSFTEPSAGPGFESLVQAESRAVAALSREIAAALKAVVKAKPNP